MLIFMKAPDSVIEWDGLTTVEERVLRDPRLEPTSSPPPPQLEYWVIGLRKNGLLLA
jgi:hypothetical protein